jgi:beta-aspartyl-peptidase (threonine type)
MPIAIVVHGGAGLVPAERLGTAQAGCKDAAKIGWEILQAGGSALDAVEATVQALENNPNYNAGTGSCLTSAGNIEMDAGIMEGHTLNVGSVAGVERIKNPIQLARKVLASPHILLIGQGAQQFALQQGMSLCKFEELLTERQLNNWRSDQVVEEVGNDGEERSYYRRILGSIPSRDDRQNGLGYEKKYGTVGAVAVDASGNLAAATSTGGFRNKIPGRVGDSPLVGCGFYADENAAISCTGYGEDFIRLLLAKRAADFVAQGSSAQEAAEAAISILGDKTEGTGGLIVVDRDGNVGYAWNSENLVYAAIS